MKSLIKRYTIDVDDEKMGISLTAIIKIVMMTHDHTKIKNLIKAENHIVEVYRVSSDGCYFLKIAVENN
jgi:DNA-binding Lrp family transcriptional regulator